jgi:hypothetical protein
MLHFIKKLKIEHRLYTTLASIGIGALIVCSSGKVEFGSDVSCIFSGNLENISKEFEEF